MYRGLVSIGAINKGDTAPMNEYMQIIASTNQKQVELLGKVDSGVNEKMALGIANLSTSFNNPAVLKNVMSSIQGGLEKPASPQMEALQFAALSRINPKASLFQMQKMRERPTLEYAKSLLGMLSGASYNEENFAQNIMGGFDVSANIASDIATGFRTKGLEGVDFSKIKGLDIEGGAEKTSAAMNIKVASSKTDNIFADYGDILAQKTEEVIVEFKKWITGATEKMETVLTEADKINKENVDAFGVAVDKFKTGVIDYKTFSGTYNPLLPKI
jgi:hypothetical protein